MGFYTLEQRRPVRPVTARAVLQTCDIKGATNWAKAAGEHAKGLDTKRSVDPQEPVYTLPSARSNRWYEGAPAPTIDPTRRPRTANTNSVADIDGATKRKPTLFQVPRDPFRSLDEHHTCEARQLATRDIMLVRDISRPPSANPMRRDLVVARPHTAAPARRRHSSKRADTQSTGGALAAVALPAILRPQTACGDVGAVVRAAQPSLQPDWSFASHAALGNELQPSESRPQSTSRAFTQVDATALATSSMAGAVPNRPRGALQQERGERREQARDAAQRRVDIMLVRQLPSFMSTRP